MNRIAVPLAPTPLLASLIECEASSPQSVLPDDVTVPERFFERALFHPLREVAQRPGKEFRGRLSAIAWDLAGGKGAPPSELATIVEAYHLGSLIVDDIQDGSETRRGAPSLHRVCGVPLALNAGNWLYFWPGVVLARAEFDARTKVELRGAIDRAVLRCHYGQALDLSVRVPELRQREVRDVVYGTTRLKTGSLMELAAELGALAAGATEATTRALACLGRDIGVGLQMLDDLTSITSSRRRHKAREDLVGGRPTWVWVWLAEQVDDLRYQRVRAAAEAVVSGEGDPQPLAEQLSELVAERGRASVRRHLATTLRAVRSAVGEHKSISELEGEVAELERYDG